MTVTEKLAALRQNMEARGLAGCIVVTDDFHGSEYVGAHFKAREFLSGFTGSAGTLTVLREGAYLWTDGRYFLQAERAAEGQRHTADARRPAGRADAVPIPGGAAAGERSPGL